MKHCNGTYLIDDDFCRKLYVQYIKRHILLSRSKLIDPSVLKIIEHKVSNISVSNIMGVAMKAFSSLMENNTSLSLELDVANVYNDVINDTSRR